MSLVILKVDREKKTHSIYCEGIGMREEHIYLTQSNKITHIDNPHYSILLGTTGNMEFTRYFRLHFEEHFKKSDMLQNLSNCDLGSDNLKDIIHNIWCSFCADRTLSLNTNCFSSFGCILSINGNLYVADHYRCDDQNTFSAYKVTDRDYCVNGQEEIAALCLLENDIKIQDIFDTICKFNNSINNNVSSIENISYSDKIQIKNHN